MKEKNFKFRESFAKLIKSMNDKQAGEFIRNICGYVFEDKPFETKDKFLKGAFVYMQNELNAERNSVKFGLVGALKSMEKLREQQIYEAADAAASASVTSVIIEVEKTVDETPTAERKKIKRHYKSTR